MSFYCNGCLNLHGSSGGLCPECIYRIDNYLPSSSEETNDASDWSITDETTIVDSSGTSTNGNLSGTTK